MNKKKYYVSVQSGSILSSPEFSTYEFEIEATPQEITQLRELFDFYAEADNATFVRGHIPGIPYHYDDENDAYDKLLQNIYQMLHQLGTPETRSHIEEMGLMNIEGTK